MKQISVLVKQVLMSTLTAGMFAVSFTAFTACSDDSFESEVANNNNETNFIGGSNKIEKPLALKFEDYITPNDVQILNDDTTLIAVSKAYADKINIQNFVNHPLSIWQSKNELGYLRRATAQRMDGDKYILEVVPSGLGEIIQSGDVKLSTALYVNPSKAAATRSGEGAEYGAQYIDNDNVIHPMAITIPMETVTRGGGSGNITITPEELLGYQTRGLEDIPKNIEDFFVNLAKGFADGDMKNGINFKNVGGKWNLISLEPSLNNKFPISCGKDDADTITISVSGKSNFQLGYRLNLSVEKMKVTYFETALFGEFAFCPQVTIGSSRKLEIPDDKSTLELAPLASAAFTFPVMGVPVPVLLKNHLDLKFDASVEGKIYTGLKYEFASEFEAGLKYDGRWHTIANGEIKKNELSFITPRATIHAETGVGLYFCTDVLIGGVAGPTASIGPKIMGEMDMVFAPMEKIPFKFDAAIKEGIYGEVGAKLSLWKIELGKFSCPFTIGSDITLWEYSSWKNDNSNATDKNTAYFEELKKQSEEEAAKARHEDNMKTFSVCEQAVKYLMEEPKLYAYKARLGELRFETLIASVVKDYIAQHGEESLKNFSCFDNTYDELVRIAIRRIVQRQY